MISYVLPTRNRPACLAKTLGELGALPAHQAEVIVVDNASDLPAAAAARLENGLAVRVLRRERNEGAAARNAGVRTSDAASQWVVMLDDDSHPMDVRFLHVLREQPADVAAVCAEIVLPPAIAGIDAGRARHEAGGLPEVPIGCGVAYRREAFLSASVPGMANEAGYDPRFGFYAEEYDLAARLMRSGGRIVMDRRFLVRHEKTSAGRSMDTILRRLVRNNAWVMRRYAPDRVCTDEVRRTIARYARIAWKEHATLGYAAGLAETLRTLRGQPRAELNASQWERFTGKSACRRGLLRQWAQRRFASAMIVAAGKNEHVVREMLGEMGVRLVDREEDAEALVIGTLSPGPALDAHARLASDERVLAPWPVTEVRTEPGQAAQVRADEGRAAA